MDSELEFPEINQKETELIRSYHDVQTNFIAAEGFFDVPRNALLRSHAVSAIAKCYKQLSKTAQPDAFIPYLAVNFFDRYISRHKNVLEDVEAGPETERLRLIAFTCFTLSAKLRNKHFSAEEFWTQLKVSLTPEARMEVELLILHELKWELQPLTAFTFLNYYYSYFKQFGRFYRRSIYEILVQAQGDNTFVHYNPSLVAFSAFLAASKLAYPKKYNKNAHTYVLSQIGSEDKVEQCIQDMVKLCSKMEIKIETPESGTGSTSSNIVAVPKQSRGKAVIIFDSSEEEDEGEETRLIPRKRGTVKMPEKSKVQLPVQAEELSDSDDEVREVTEIFQVQVPLQAEELFDSNDEVTEKTEAEKQELIKGKLEAVDVTETFVDDKARIEATIRRAVVKGGKAEMGEKPQPQVGGSILEAVAPKVLMNFELKWLTKVPPLGKKETPRDSPTTVGIKIRDGERPKTVTCGCNII